jgi:tetratricopeptide (TPR) repeat protein
MEFEFVEGDAGGGRFVATGKVLGVIQGHLTRGEVREAARLYQGCTREVTARLLEETKLASSRLRTALMEMFVLARDHEAAARCAEGVDDPGKAAGFFEAAYQFPRAAEMYQRAGDLPKAALMYEKAMDFGRAGRMYLQAGETARAAECLERAGELLDAARLHLKTGNWKQGGAILNAVPTGHADYFEASTLMAEILWRTGHRDMAVQRLAELLRALPPRAEMADSYYRFAEMLEDVGHADRAAAVLERIETLRPGFKDVRDRLAAMRRMSALPPTPAAEPAAGSPPPLDLHGTQAAAEDEVQVIDQDLEKLRDLPLLAELGHDEIRELGKLSGRLRFEAGHLVLREGSAGRGLFIVVEGEVEVVVGTTVVARLGPGEHFGEMSLLDDVAVSATVRTTAPSVLLGVPREDLLRFLYLDERAASKVYRHFARTLARRLAETNAARPAGR